MTPMPRTPDIPGLTDLVPIGQGGNGVVYRATQAQLRRVVAVKLLAARLDDASAQRFAREGQALGIVSGHPNIVPVYTADTTADGTPYLVMLLCENGSLSDRVEQRGPMSVPAVIDLGIRMCGALQTAHDAGLLHRDIKPGNILFDSYDVPRLADFGQARLADANLTKTGDVVATPGYAAPEVLTGERATVRSDVYSLATTLMAALLGHGPFSRDTDENVAATLLRVLQEPPPDLRRIGVPPQLAAELERAMDKTPGRRQMSAGELGRRLQDVQAGLGLPHTPMIIAGAAAAGSPLPPVTGAGFQEDRTRQLDEQRRSGATAVMGPHAATPTTPVPKRSRLKWIAVLAALALLTGLGIWGITALGSSREPTNPTQASDLLIGSDAYGPGDWQIGEDVSLISDVIGQVPENPDEGSTYPTSLSKCLGLDLEQQVKSAKPSAQYYDADDTSTKDDGESYSKYRLARSLALVVATPTAAKNIVTAYASPGFDTCLEDAGEAGITVGKESKLYGAQTKTSVPAYEPDVPDGVTYQARQIEIPLERAADSEESETDADGKTKQQGSRFVTIVALAAGTSVDFVVMQSDNGTVEEDMLDGVVERFVDLATK